MKLKKLTWDSDFFQIEVGKLIWDPSINLNESQIDEYDLVYLFSDEAIAQENFDRTQNRWDSKLVDIKLTFIKKVEPVNSLHPDIRMLHEMRPYETLKTLALISGEYSRYKLDKNFDSKDFERLYTQWIENSFNDIMAKKVYIHEINDEISGMISLNYDKPTAQIGLIAVKPKYRGNGIAHQLLKAAEYESFLQKMDFLEVATQKDNAPAVQLYLKNGFEPKTQTYIYHLWKIKK